MNIAVLTLFPAVFEPFLSTSMVGKAVESGVLGVRCYNIRDFSEDKHKKVDAPPFGGGAGMLMTYQPLKSALLEAKKDLDTDDVVVWLMSPRGRVLTQSYAVEEAHHKALVLICGHYEGVDQRFIDQFVDQEISIGDYVLTGGELPAMVVIDALSRFQPNVLGNQESVEEESFMQGLLEYDQYTRPYDVDGHVVPDVLRSGNHAEIKIWRHENAKRVTKKNRPDLFQNYQGIKDK